MKKIQDHIAEARTLFNRLCEKKGRPSYNLLERWIDELAYLHSEQARVGTEHEYEEPWVGRAAAVEPASTSVAEPKSGHGSPAAAEPESASADAPVNQSEGAPAA